MSDTLDRLRKLLALANDSHSPESQTARKLYERLLERYDLSAEAVEGGEASWHTFRYKRGDKMIVARIVHHFEWPAEVGDRRQTIRVHCTRDELTMLRDLYAHAKGISDRLMRDLRRQHKSFVLGYLDRAFPMQSINLPCPRCGETHYNFSPRHARYICGACGHASRKVNMVDTDRAAYLDGVRHGGLALTANRLAGGEKPVVVFIDDRGAE